jgi:hypothetical protein
MTSRKSRADEYKTGTSKKNAQAGARKKAAKGSASKKSAGASKSSAKSSSKSSARKGGLGATATSWTGTPTTINQNQNLQMSRTPNGTLIFSYFNQSKTANDGVLQISSGGAMPTKLPVPALANQPLLYVNNWGGSNLSVSNTSTTTTPIWVVAAGPGMPGQTCKTLTSDGTPLTLGIYACATANAPAQYVNVSLQANSSLLTIFAIQVGNNVWVIALNDPVGESGPNSGSPSTAPPAGYYATTSTNNYQGTWYWGGASVYVVNLSPGTSIPAQVSLLPT